MRLKYRPKQRLQVTWIDAFDLSGWHSESDIVDYLKKESRDGLVHTISHFVMVRDGFLVLASDYCNEGDDLSWGLINFIPLAWVKTIKPLE